MQVVNVCPTHFPSEFLYWFAGICLNLLPRMGCDAGGCWCSMSVQHICQQNYFTGLQKSTVFEYASVGGWDARRWSAAPAKMSVQPNFNWVAEIHCVVFECATVWVGCTQIDTGGHWHWSMSVQPIFQQT